MRTDIENKKELIIELIEENRPKSFICKTLDCRPHTLDGYLKKWNINYIGNRGGKKYKVSPKRMTAVEYMNNENYIKSSTLSKKLIQDGLKEKKCEKCNLEKWLDEDIPLELHHKDGNRFNNKLENLQILCCNCHALTENYGSKNKKVKKEIKKIIFIEKVKNKLCNCGKNKQNKSKYCIECSHKKQRKTERPSFEILTKEIEQSSFVSVGKKYGVSDNAIRKWIKNYKKIADVV